MRRPRLPDGRIPLDLSVDWGIDWPLSDMTWPDGLDWDRPERAVLKRDLIAWSAFFNRHADLESESWDSLEHGRRFDAEGQRLTEAVQRTLGPGYAVTLSLWFRAK